MLSTIIAFLLSSTVHQPAGYMGPCVDDTCRLGPEGEELICVTTYPLNPAILATWCTTECKIDTDCPQIEGSWFECRYGACTQLCESQDDCITGQTCVPAPLEESWCVWYV